LIALPKGREETGAMKIGILVTGHVLADLTQKHGEYPRMFERLLDGHGFTFIPYLVVDGHFPDDVTDCHGWIVTGSAHGAYDPLPWIPKLEDFIRKAYAAGVPMVGICFGHQIMAQALGGKVEKFSGGWGFGRHRYRGSDGSEFELHAMHQDQVVVRPPEAEVTASSQFCENAAFAYRGKAISFQPHPEFSRSYTEDLIRKRIGTRFTPEEGEAAIAQLADELDSPQIAAQIASFFKESARRVA
jgi:GMP synthase-like glutamine amidotransferase